VEGEEGGGTQGVIKQLSGILWNLAFGCGCVWPHRGEEGGGVRAGQVVCSAPGTMTART
jgi:hypothetical protein